MRRPWRWWLHSEDGASAAVVVVLLVVLIGILALSVDGGAMYMKRRAVVNATDSGALAAAQQYALGNAICGSSDTPAQTAADQTATANVGNATRWEYLTNCADQTVTVGYQAQQQLFFSEIFGRSTATASTTATAKWGGAGTASGIMPFMLDWTTLTSCQFVFPPGPPKGTQCTFWFNNKQVGTAQWSQLNLNQWNATPQNPYKCTGGSTQQMLNWINGGAPNLSLNYPDPTYVCRGTGYANAVFFGNCTNTPTPLACHVGQEYAWPVNDNCTAGAYDSSLTEPQGQADSNFALDCPPNSPYYYDIIGFAWMELSGVFKGNSPEAQQYCGSYPYFSSDPNAICLVTTWEGYSTSASGGPGGGHNFGLETIALTG